MLNNPRETALFNVLNTRVKGALSSWQGTQFATQAYSAAASTMAEMWQAWKNNPKNEGITVQDPEFLKWVDDTQKFLQREFMDADEWTDLQQGQIDIQRQNKIEPYVTTLFETNPQTLKLYYAETILMRENRPPSSGLSKLFDTPGHKIPADAPVDDFKNAILAQMKLAGIDIESLEVKAEIDSIINGLRPRLEEEAEEIEKPAEETSDTGDSTDKFSALRAQRQAENKAALELISKTAGAVSGAVGSAIVGFANVMASTRPLQPQDLDKSLTVRQILELKTRLLAGEEEEEELGLTASATN